MLCSLIPKHPTEKEFADMEIIDTHAHYDDRRFDDKRDEIIAGVLDTGYIRNIINAGCNIKSSRAGLELSKRYPQFYFTAGIHPHDTGAAEDRERTLFELETLLREKKCVALGEIGLDYHYDFSDSETQKKWFEYQMQLAKRLGMPVAIHDREAHGDCMDMIRKYPDVVGEFHSFSGSVEMAKELVSRGWYISFSGVITFKNASKILEVVKTVPLDRIMIETDAPYLAPVPMRGKDNNSSYMKYTAEAAAKVIGITTEEFCALTTENARRFFGI